MKAAAFDYTAPTTVQEAIHSLNSAGDAAKLLAGGQSLLPMLAMRLARPSLLVDLNRIKGLSEIHRKDGHLLIGAMTRHRDLETNQTIRQVVPILAHMAGHIGHVAIRNRGTVGGSIAHADPAAELPLAMTVLDARFTVQGPKGTRTLAPDQLFVGALTTSLAPDEVLTAIRVPIPSSSTHSSFLKLARRHGDFGIVAVLVVVELDKEGRYEDVRVGLGGANPVPVRARAVESMLVGEKPSETVVAAAAKAAVKEIEPSSDVHATAAYRREMVEVLVRRTLLAASELH